MTHSGSRIRAPSPQPSPMCFVSLTVFSTEVVHKIPTAPYPLINMDVNTF